MFCGYAYAKMIGLLTSQTAIMFKKIAFLVFASVSSQSLASNVINLHQAPMTSLDKFKLIEKHSNSVTLRSATSEMNALQALSQTKNDGKTIIRYQQLYQGIPVVGAQIMIVKQSNHTLNAKLDSQVNGHLVEEIQLDTQPIIDSQAALNLVKKAYFNGKPQTTISAETTQLQIRTDSNNNLALVYLISFKTVNSNNQPIWPFFIINAQTGEITKQWNNIKYYLDAGPGGNEKVHQYWYGKDKLPALDVTQNDNLCTMENDKVKLINLKSQWDWEETLQAPYQYTCNNNDGDSINGAFSPNNDAYYFGHTILDMYQNWYGIPALQDEEGNPTKLIMRTHFGQSFDNAFWDGIAMNFGDGDEFYPLVSLDVASHEVTHGFTEQHSNLEYHDESGSLNESISDMAGITSRAYLLNTNPKLYNKAHLVPNQITWGIGETIVRDTFGKALRFMNTPSSDGSSADCLDRKIARKNNSSCIISYDDIVFFANAVIPDEEDRQNFIVHSGSGVFNRAFYLLSQKIGIQKTYQIMINANTSYWTPTTDFAEGACGVVFAANDLKIEQKVVQSAFGKVGIDTSNCFNPESAS